MSIDEFDSRNNLVFGSAKKEDRHTLVQPGNDFFSVPVLMTEAGEIFGRGYNTGSREHVVPARLITGTQTLG